MKQNYALDIDFQTYNAYNSMHFNRLLAHALGAEEALIFASLVSKYFYYESRDILDNPDGWFYVTEADLQESTTFKEKVQRKAIKHLVESGLVEYKLMGLPAKRYFRIVNNNSNLHALEEKGLAISKEIYAKTTEANLLKSLKKPEKSSSSQKAELVSQSANADFSSSAKMAELAPANGRNLILPKGGTCSCEQAEHYNHNLNNHNLNNHDLINQSVSTEAENFQQNVESCSDGQTDRDISEVEMSYSKMLEEIHSPFADSDIKNETDLSSFDETDRQTRECEIPYSMKEDRRAFRSALQYLCAYSYRTSDLSEDMVNLLDTVIDCITELVTSDKPNAGKRVYHYYDVIDNLNEIIHRTSLFDWVLLFKDKWKAICTEKQQNGNPIKNQRLYMKPFIYDFLSEYKIESLFPELV